MSLTTAPAGQSSADSSQRWQEELQKICTHYNAGSPSYELLSDRRGGRTAWSCRVEVNGNVFPAQYWYDGRNVNGAREDAAYIACKTIYENLDE